MIEGQTYCKMKNFNSNFRILKPVQKKPKGNLGKPP